MNGTAKERSLTAEERTRIREAVDAAQAPDDPDPWEVVAERFGGDWDAYLRAMARWHGIPLEEGKT